MDGMDLAIWESRFTGIVRKMVNTLFRTGRSGVINSAHDCSCAILTRDGDLITTSDSLLIHVMAGPDMMARALIDLHPNLQPGDAFLHNSPYHGNSHPADLSVLVPVFDDDGVHRYTVLAKAHQADIGNAMPTTYAIEARDVYEEGAMIFPVVRCQQGYRDIDDIIRMCRVRIRVPDQWYADYLSLVGACRIGEREIRRLLSEAGVETLAEFATSWSDYGESRVSQAIAALPAAEVSATSTHDPFPGAPDGLPIRARVTTFPDQGRIRVDLRDNPDCVASGMNLSEACSRTAALIGVFNSLGQELPLNSGSLRPIEILLRENCVTGIPRHPQSCAVATTNVSDRVINAVQKAMSKMGDSYGMAEAGAIIPPAGGVISGRDPRNGHPFINKVLLGLTAGQAGPHADGWLTAMHAGSSGVCRHDSVEIDELKYPIVIRERSLVTDSEGAGHTCGAPSGRVEFGPLGCDFEIMFAADGRYNPADGARGGLSGGPAQCLRRKRDGGLEEIPSFGRIPIRDGETVISVSPGGGGYGMPTERPAAAVALQVAEEFVSRGRAEAVYGVVLDADGNVDQEATARKRAEEGSSDGS